MKVAIVHDWLTLTGGAERVLDAMLEIYPQADVFCVVCFLAEEDMPLLRGKVPRTTFIQRLPFARRFYRSYLALMPIAIEQLDVTAYDLVISSSYAVAKGVITGPDQMHISYVHSPIRYAWDLQHDYLKEARIDTGFKSLIARAILHYIRLWDVRTSNGVDHFIANSRFIRARIAKVYRRSATVIHPPADTSRFTMRVDKEDFYVTASRMVPYKHIPLIAKAFAKMPDKRLIIIGDGPQMDLVKEIVAPNITLLGRQDNDVLVDYMQRAKAFVFAAKEDFGIVPLEAQACGTPVIAYGAGGSLETVIGEGPDRTGVFFADQTIESIAGAVAEFETLSEKITATACRRNADRFGTERFKRELLDFVEAKMAHQGALAEDQPVAFLSVIKH